MFLDYTERIGCFATASTTRCSRGNGIGVSSNGIMESRVCTRLGHRDFMHSRMGSLMTYLYVFQYTTMICFYVFLLHVVVYAAAIDRLKTYLCLGGTKQDAILHKKQKTRSCLLVIFHPSYETPVHENGKVVLLSHEQQAFDVDTQVSDVLNQRT